MEKGILYGRALSITCRRTIYIMANVGVVRDGSQLGWLDQYGSITKGGDNDVIGASQVDLAPTNKE